ncbi:hypothetical protein BJ165DRAFT_1529358 [Panaeolus papilionaceus]|nr:hypothetical protein BJ165DRAFT_1529358 [Panaeolus papilionaceus]
MLPGETLPDTLPYQVSTMRYPVKNLKNSQLQYDHTTFVILIVLVAWFNVVDHGDFGGVGWAFDVFCPTMTQNNFDDGVLLPVKLIFVWPTFNPVSDVSSFSSYITIWTFFGLALGHCCLIDKLLQRFSSTGIVASIYSLSGKLTLVLIIST